MRFLATRLLCLIAAFTLVEGPTVTYQIWAWANMLNERIPERGVADAVDSTFSGEEPCEHCKSIAKHEAEKKRKEAPVPELTPLAKAVSATSRPAKLTPPSATRLPFLRIDLFLLNQFQPELPFPPPDFA